MAKDRLAALCDGLLIYEIYLRYMEREKKGQNWSKYLANFKIKFRKNI